MNRNINNESISQESSQSDISDHQKQHLRQISNHKFMQYQDSQESDDQDNLDSDDQERSSDHEERQKQTIQQNDGQSEEDSIDYIEERIKKLQRDLQERLGKQKQPKIQQNTLPQFPKQKLSPKITKISPQQPPLPKRRPNSGCGTKQLSQPIKLKQQPKPIQRLSPTYQKQTIAPKKKNQKKENSNTINNQQKQIKQIRQIKQSIEKTKKINNKSNTITINSQNHQIKQSKKQLMLEKQVKQQQKIIDQLKLENKRLKSQQQQQQQSQQQQKKKPLQQLIKLKQFSQSTSLPSNHNKLDKQIQLLQVIQKLQIKLKNSINRKLIKIKGNSSATLLHKGLSTGIIN